jgi:hypothetical protein
MPSLLDFDVAVLSVNSTNRARLPEYNVRNDTDTDLPPLHTTPFQSAKVNSPTKTEQCQCFIPSAPNQHFQVMVTNKSATDICVTVYVDGEWVYSGLSYGTDHKTVFIVGRLIDESHIEEMRFVGLDTTCTPASLL